MESTFKEHLPSSTHWGKAGYVPFTAAINVSSTLPTMKQRFSSLDVKVIAHELNQSLVTLRLSNIYDLSSKILLFKFAKPDVKKHLVVDTGFRCHLTEFARTTAAAPSPFVARLRKFLKTRRLTSVAQVGTDRILDFQFSDGQYRLFLEFFASGNLVLTDSQLNILAIARNVSQGENQEPQRIGLTYSLENRQNFLATPPLTKERIRNALESAAVRTANTDIAAKQARGKSGGDLRKILAVSITELPPVLVDHVLRANSFDTTVQPDQLLQDENMLDQLVRLLGEARSAADGITTTSECKGYIFAKQRQDRRSHETTQEASKREDVIYQDFHPFVPYKLKTDSSISILEFTGYNKTVDEFFSSLEGQKLESRLTEREATAKRKIEAVRQDQAKRIQGLQEAQTLNYRKAAAIETNVERVQEAMDAVNGLISQGMDWVDIGKLIQREKGRQNAVAQVIALPLKLSENIITLKLAEEEFEDEGEEDPFETDDSEASEDEADKASSKQPERVDKTLSIDINLTLSPWSNAREYYDQRRSAVVKESKTQMQAAKALKNTEHKIKHDLAKGLKQEKALLQPIRKQMWFEKFIWFISSDGYLVLGGNDSAQDEMLYKRYLRKGDAYCHADLQGAANVIIKNKATTPDAPIPPATLSQAGSLSVCCSDAWDSKAGMGAWWVNANQVSKTGSMGEVLPLGRFVVQGEKNHLPPAQLLLGLGIMFRISEQSKANHVKHRLNDDSVAVENSSHGPVMQAKLEDYSLGGIDNDEGGAEQDDVGAQRHTPKEEHVDDEDANEDESGEGTNRSNPLQNFGSDEDYDDVDMAQEATAKLTTKQEPTGPAMSEDAVVDELKEIALDTGHQSDVAKASQVPLQASQASLTTQSNPSTDKPGQLKRGKRGKAKKMANKYKEQDEEDRKAAQALIGATAGQERAEAAARAKAQAQADAEAAKERRRAQHQRQQKEMAQHEERRRVGMDGGVETLQVDEEEQATALDVLVGTPLPGDELLEAVPVCAPWMALGRFKYKAKMQPGATKKGKAVKEVLERWRADAGKKGAVDESSRDAEKMWPREVELIKAQRPEEVINSVPVGKVRIMMSGGGGGSGSSKVKGGGGGGKGGRGGRGSKR
ncbi:hypothetical protein CDD81_3057 [Ophiocordyceps australis]|uniref:Ribosome quality control complex subunit 2 n=1 Tax=Ophiocordyceps australis TaxID=1399860 RepID=A0A2C5XJV1_9HYPO|nr:hypothetical protein CDD81_3057 [Ophiocordyceps australis]